MTNRWLSARRMPIWAAVLATLVTTVGLTSTGLVLPAAAVAATATATTNVRAWGDNSLGDLGTGRNGGFSTVPVMPKNLGVVKAVSAGGVDGLALLADGTVAAWGDNSTGQLGDGTTTFRTKPVKVHGLTNVVAISAGAHTSLALLSNGTAMAWGDNLSGEVGNASVGGMTTVPVPVTGLTNLTAIAGANDFSFAIRKDGALFAWGDNGSGELGIGSFVAQSNVPVRVAGLSGVKAVVGGTLHALAILANGTVMSWGLNAFGELGTGARFPSGSNVPVKVDGIHTAVGVAAGYEHSAALLANGTVMSWGANVFGQLGIGTRNVQQSLDPIAVEGVHTATAISAGDFQTQALLRDGTVMGWGDDDAGQLGDGTTNPEVVSPVSVTGLTGATSLSVGGAHAFAIVGG